MMNIVTQHACIHYSGDTVLVTLSALNYSKLCLCKHVQHAGRLLMMLLPTTKLSTLLRFFPMTQHMKLIIVPTGKG